MKDLDSYRFLEEIRFFKNQIAPSERQKLYLADCKEKIEGELGGQAEKSGHPIERCMLVALCGELTKTSTQKQQAEFASRLLLLELLMEPE